ncbi:MAG TPA: T9SS type A sorting domain-containing protein [Brumimicrobium sp.]|nr:T9SS type A sorting domain-containing protein [Brumimicrobium sp.]
MKNLILLISSLLFSFSVVSQAGLNDSTFNTYDIGFGKGDGFNYHVESVAIQSDGKTIAVGGFTTFDKKNANHIIRLNIDGSRDTSFHIGTGFDLPLFSVVIQDDDKIIVAGDFSYYNGIEIRRIVRLNSDGTLDTSFDPLNSADKSINKLSLQPDGKIIIGGKFTTFNYSNRNCIARLNSDGSLDQTFDPGTGFDTEVKDIQVQNDGKIIVGGFFTMYNGSLRNMLVRLNEDGTLDNSFNIGTGFNYRVNSIAVQNNGKIIIGGNFTSYNGVAKNKIVRLLIDGTVDATFNTGSGLDFELETILIQSDNKILIGGAFSIYNGIQTNRISRLNLNGTLDSSFANTSNIGGEVFCLAIQNNGQIISAGSFTYVESAINNYFARFNADGSVDMSVNLGSGFDAKVWDIALQSTGKIIVVGEFTFFNGVLTRRIARLNADGTLDSTFVTGIGFGFTTTSVTIQDDDKIIVGSFRTSYNGLPENAIIRLNANGTHDSTFNTGTGFNNAVHSIIVQNNGKIIVQGSINIYNGNPVGNIVRLNSDGSLDTSFDIDIGPGGPINSIALQSDEKIIIGGYFSTFNGNPAKNIARLNTNGSFDNSFLIGAGFNDDVYAIAIQNDDKIIVTGTFTSYDYDFGMKTVRLNKNGILDSTFNTGGGILGIAEALVIQSDGKIIAGGNFNSYNGTPRNKIVRINRDGSLDSSFDPGQGIGSSVTPKIRALAIQSDDNILVGGEFSFYDTLGRNRITRLLPGCMPTESTDVQESCYSYIWIDGITYFSNNDSATYVTQNIEGCDSIITLNLVIHDSVTGVDNQIASQPFTWIDGITYTADNDSATFILQNVNGCDSVVTLNLIFQLNTSLNVVGNTISAVNADATYQWIDCSNNNLIPNETAQSFTATIDGDYAVILNSTTVSCIDTSVCINIDNLGIDAEYKNKNTLIYPNPNNGNFNVESNRSASIIVFNSIGNQVTSKNISSGKTQFKLDYLDNGIYYIISTDVNGVSESQIISVYR